MLFSIHFRTLHHRESQIFVLWDEAHNFQYKSGLRLEK